MSDERIREPLRSLYAEGGYLSFDIGEFWQLLSASMPAEQLAINMFQSAEAPEIRSAFVSLIIQKYDSFTDAERRAVLEGLQFHVHNAALDRAVTALTSLENAAHQHAFSIRNQQAMAGYLRAMKRTLVEIAGQDVLDRLEAMHGVDPFHVLETEASEAASGMGAGRTWQQTREAWRKRCEELFLSPVSPSAPKLSDLVSDIAF